MHLFPRDDQHIHGLGLLSVVGLIRRSSSSHTFTTRVQHPHRGAFLPLLPSPVSLVVHAVLVVVFCMAMHEGRAAGAVGSSGDAAAFLTVEGTSVGALAVAEEGRDVCVEELRCVVRMKGVCVERVCIDRVCVLIG